MLVGGATVVERAATVRERHGLRIVEPRVVRTPEENYRAIVKMARLLEPLGLKPDDWEEAVMLECFRTLGTGGYNRATVSRAIASVVQGGRA